MTASHTLHIDLGARSYPIVVGYDLLDDRSLVANVVGKAKRVAIVSNEVVAPLYLDRLQATLTANGIASLPIVLPDGETHKNWQTLQAIFDALLSGHAERNTPLIALGGGVIGDMTGFAAACYQRGAPYIQVPTTLLAQVDSSVGGKTAINHPLGKNMIGAFYQPRAVLADLGVLSTLPPRELASGLAEVIKYALIRDRVFADWLEQHMLSLRALDQQALIYAVLCSCQHKAAIVANDEHERGERALLNLGHTFGHAIETVSGYGQFLHGEAVAIGTAMAAALSRHLDWLSHEDEAQIIRLLTMASLPVDCPPSLTTESLLAAMAHDKKVIDGRLRLILVKGIGSGVVADDIPLADIAAAIDARRPCPK